MAAMNTVISSDDTISSSGALSITTSGNTSDYPYISTSVNEEKYAIKVDGAMSINGNINSEQWEELEKGIQKLKEANKMAQMGLYEVVVVDTKKRKIIAKNIVIARNEDKAKIKVVMGQATDVSDDAEFFVRCIGTWEDRKPKEVKIVKE